MTTFFKSGLLLSVLFLIANSCTSVKLEEVKDGNSLLWQISKANQPTSYLFGTMHLIEEEYYEFTPNLKHLIKSSDAVVMELGDMPNPLEAMALMKLQTGTLEDLFTAENYQKILYFFNEKLNTSESQFKMIYNSFKPFFMFQAITQSYYESPPKSYDMDIMAFSKSENIPLIGLETIHQQIGFFDSIPYDEISEMIIESFESFDQDIEEMKTLQKLYHEEKVKELIPLIKQQSPEFMKYEDLFLNNRNKAWIPKLSSEFSQKSCFVAVGAAHLFGKNGIIELLKQEGYEIKAIKK